MPNRKITGGTVVGVVIVCLWGFLAALGGRLVRWDAFSASPSEALQAPSALHWLGTDALGRDVLARIIVGSDAIFTIAPMATAVGVIAGTSLGVIVGYRGGVADIIISRVLDALMALPMVILAMIFLTVLGPSTETVVLVVASLYVAPVTRTIRAAVRVQASREYISAARMRGLSSIHIILSEILPNIKQAIFIETVVRLGYAFFTVATLSFLGLGVQAPSADWGLAIAENYGYLAAGAWWPVLFNAVSIASLVVGTNLIAEGLGVFE